MFAETGSLLKERATAFVKQELDLSKILRFWRKNMSFVLHIHSVTQQSGFHPLSLSQRPLCSSFSPALVEETLISSHLDHS